MFAQSEHSPLGTQYTHMILTVINVCRQYPLTYHIENHVKISQVAHLGKNYKRVLVYFTHPNCFILW